MEKLLGLPVLASEHGQHVDQLIWYVHLLMGALFVGWLAYFLLVLFKFRASRSPKADYIGAQTHATTWVEVGVAAVEAGLLIIIAVPFWSKLVDNFPKETEAVVVKVAAQQFAWNFRYTGPDGEFGKQDIKLVSASNSYGMVQDDPAGQDDIQTLNEMRVPLNKSVVLHITSRDVIHSFKVAAFRLTQDAIPGMMIPTHFKATKTGRYQIICAQLCGNGHYGMASGFVYVDTEEDYNNWIQSKIGGGGATSFE
ncbi:MAG: cytochrome c oxidase subunit II [Verrucomicrobia bacterium]|nr:cytochrome c oxidase subunit II [Verrucomicrobiota bacterium]